MKTRLIGGAILTSVVAASAGVGLAGTAATGARPAVPVIPKDGYSCDVNRAADPIGATFLGRYSATGAPGGETAAEIVAYSNRTMYVMNYQAIDVVDMRDPSNPTKITSLPLPSDPTSVAAYKDLVAVAVPATNKTDRGHVYLFRKLQLVGTVEVGALPDMVTFTPNGHHILVANEGEPNSYGLIDSVDPEGSVSVIDVHHTLERLKKNRSLRAKDVRTIGFADFNVGGTRNGELPAGVRIFGPGSSVAQDLEPEYITVSKDNKWAWVTLQENNAVAKIDLRKGRVASIAALGTLDHSLPGNGLDASDKDSAINIQNWPVQGMFLPDGIANVKIHGEQLFLTANEGDVREWPGILPLASDESKRAKSGADTTLFPDAATDAKLGRLKITLAAPATLNGSNKATTLFSYGTRSFSIRSAQGDLVWDSGDDIECIISTELPASFNASNSSDTFDDRSDDKGPEPESVVVGSMHGRKYAFVGLERIGGVVVYDITNPRAPEFERYLTTRTFGGASVGPDSGPEGMVFVPAGKSPTKKPLVIYGNETTGTVAIWQIEA